MPADSGLHTGAYIVCADDAPTRLELLITTLRDADHCVFATYDGQAALKLVTGLRIIDLLITSTRTPGLNGPELIGTVRQEFPLLPILCVKARAGPAVPGGLPDDVAILVEPFTRDQLLGAIKPLLARRAGRPDGKSWFGYGPQRA